MRSLTAANPGLFTFDGTRTYVVGRTDVVVVDPGPDLPAHLDAVLGVVGEVASVRLLLTHGHADHAGGAAGLSARLRGVPLLGAGPGAVALADGEQIPTDEGPLTALHTPGHTREHLTFFHPAGRAAFVGDLLLGRGSTTWVAGYSGCVADYLRSLDVVAGLEVETLYPGHGPPLTDPAEAIARFCAHREDRISQVVRARKALPDADARGLVDEVYGETVPSSMMGPAVESIRAILDHLGEDVYSEDFAVESEEPR